MKSIKRSLVVSGLSLLVCISLLMGTTFAWFTDSVVNAGNVVQSGELRMQAFSYDLEPGGDEFRIEGIYGGQPFGFVPETQKKNLELDGPVFQEELWEPGKSSAKMLEVENIGNLAAKVKIYFSIFEDGLEDALWFDLIPLDEDLQPEAAFVKRPISELQGDANGQEYYTVLPEKSKKFLLVYGMKETAGNEFQNKLFTANIHLLATQVPYEADGFGSILYDDAASVYVSTPEELVNALEYAGTEEGAYLAILLKNDIDMAGVEVPGELVFENLVVDGYGHTISNMDTEGQYFYRGTDNAWRNITFENCTSLYGMLGYGPYYTAQDSTDKLWVDNVHLAGCQTYGGGFFAHTGGAAVVIKDSSVDAQTAVNPFVSGLASGGFIGNAQNYRIEGSVMSGTVVGVLSQMGGFVGQGAWKNDTTIIRDSKIDGTIRSYDDMAAIYVLAGSTIGACADGRQNIENVDYSGCKVENAGVDAKLLLGISTPLPVGSPVTVQPLESAVSASGIAIEDGKIRLTEHGNAARYKVSQSIYYDGYYADGSISHGNLSTPIKPSVQVTADELVSDNCLDDACRVLQVVEAEGLANRTKYATTDAAHAGQVAEGTYYFDARTQADGTYSALRLENGQPKILVQVVAYDVNGAYAGMATVEYAAG